MISVIIPNLNDIRIATAVSKIELSDAILEILIVDGKSTDKETLSYYESINNPRIRVLHYEDKGIFDAINYGISQAKGEIIYLQGADDVISDIAVFNEVMCFFSANSTYHGYCIGCKFVDSLSNVVREWIPNTVTRAKILMGILPPHFSLFLKKEVYDKVGRFEISGGGDLSLDSLWLVKMGVDIDDLKVAINSDHWLNMALGGLSTGSVWVVFQQNWKLFMLLKSKSWRPKTWIFLPLIKMLSKVHQVNWLNVISSHTKRV